MTFRAWLARVSAVLYAYNGVDIERIPHGLYHPETFRDWYRAGVSPLDTVAHIVGGIRHHR